MPKDTGAHERCKGSDDKRARCVKREAKECRHCLRAISLPMHIILSLLRHTMRRIARRYYMQRFIYFLLFTVAILNLFDAISLFAI